MDLKEFCKTRQFIEEISNSTKVILYKIFPELPEEEKEDIAQEVKLKIWKVISNGKKIENLRSYLWRVVYTTAIDIVNKRIKKIPLDELIEDKTSDAIFRLNNDSHVISIEKNEIKLILEKAMDSLLQDRRVVVKLYLAGMTIDEISDFLNWSRNRVRHLLYRGLKDLRGKLNEQGIEKYDK